MSETRESLQLSVTQLQEELEETKNNLFKAAECGNTLLGTNQLLNDKLEAREKEYAEQLEELQQENYSLKMKLECQQLCSSSLQQELEAALAQLEKHQANREKRQAEIHTKKTSELTLLNDDLKAEIGKLGVQVKTFQEKIKKQEDIIEQLRTEASSRGDASMLHNELMDLENLYNGERAQCEGLELELLEHSGQLEVAMMEISSLQQKIAGLEEECLDRNKMAKEWYDALQASNDSNAELACQLELLKSKKECGDEHTGSSGNSLFGEVDDRRMDVERKMISLKVKYESIERTHNTTKQQLRKIKAEMSALLCQYSATTADAAQVQRLQRALSQSKSEIHVLAAKLHRMEQQQAEGVAVQDVKKYVSAFVDLGDKAEYVHFLEQELEQEKASHTSAMNELELKRTQLLWETNKLSEAEAKLHQSQQEQAKLRKEQTKLRMRNQETEEKFEQVQTTSKQLEAERKYLEEELKRRRNRKMSPNVPTRNQCSTSKTTMDCSHENTPSFEPAAVPEKTVIPRTRRDINILEDLDKELNKGFSSLQDSKVLLSKESERMSITSEQPMEREDCSRSSDSPKKKCAAKVIRVSNNSKDTVNKCPQQ